MLTMVTGLVIVMSIVVGRSVTLVIVRLMYRVDIEKFVSESVSIVGIVVMIVSVLRLILVMIETEVAVETDVFTIFLGTVLTNVTVAVSVIFTVFGLGR